MASHQPAVDDEFIVAHTRDCSLRDGTRIRLRPVAADDKERLQAGFERLSPDSRYRRFLAPTGALTKRMLRYFTEGLSDSLSAACAGVLCAWLARNEECSLLTANKRRMTPSRRAQRPGPEGVWPKPRHTGVARLDRGPCHGAAPGALL